MGLFPETQAFCDARFRCREVHPFSWNRSQPANGGPAARNPVYQFNVFRRTVSVPRTQTFVGNCARMSGGRSFGLNDGASIQRFVGITLDFGNSGFIGSVFSGVDGSGGGGGVGLAVSCST